jgi:hypothetical protein
MLKLLSLFFVFFGNIFFSSKSILIEKVQANIETKQLENGKSIILKSKVFYQTNGNCVTHYTYPLEYFVLTNKLGEVKVYNPIDNTVIIQQDNIYSSKTSPFYFFLSGKVNDMGVSDFGFTPTKTYTEKNNIITEWKKKKMSNDMPVSMIKLVYLKENPIFMEYKDSQLNTLRKVYYYNYTKINQFNFPTIITDIVYSLKNKDSVIIKTTYSDIKTNEEANDFYFNFKIPITAKKIN